MQHDAIKIKGEKGKSRGNHLKGKGSETKVGGSSKIYQVHSLLCKAMQS